MDSMTDEASVVFPQLAIALGLGLLVGLQRQHAASMLAGLRTFPLITLTGSLVALLDRSLGASGWVLASGLASMTVLIAISNLQRLRGQVGDFGMTTEAALLIMFTVGAVVVLGDRRVAVAVGAGTAVLLQFKPELHGIAQRLGDQDLRAIMTFALITCVILPVLPNTTYDAPVPLNVLNPFEIWLMVGLMVGISLGGYLAYKFLGQTAGILLSGLLGGAISSTATTLSYARRAATEPSSAPVAALVILIASTVVFARVVVEIAVVAPAHLIVMASPVAVMMASGLIAAAAVWLLRTRRREAMPEQKNPTELGSAMLFGLVYAGVLMALAAARQYLGGQGMYAVAIVSGLTDMDAITLSTARLVLRGTEGGVSPQDGWRLIVVASMANLVFKAVTASAIGGRHLAWRVALLLGVPLLTGAALLLMPLGR
jgi:uncharacterized membrane protein (DUF4010 family)